MFGNKTNTGIYYSSNSAPQNSQRKVYIFAGLGIVLLLLIVVPVLSSLGNGLKNDIALLNAQELSLMNLTKTQANTISNYDLINANATVNTLLTSDYITVSNLLINDYSTPQLPSQTIQETSTSTDVQNLQQAATLTHFDSTYRQVLLTKISDMENQAMKILSETKGPHTTAYVGQALKNLRATAAELNAIAALQ